MRIGPKGSSYKPGSPSLLPLVVEKPLRIKGLVPFEHEVDGSANFVGEDAEGLSVTVFPFESVVELLAFREMAEDCYGRLTESPFEVSSVRHKSKSDNWL